jgi:hypothetical protein
MEEPAEEENLMYTYYEMFSEQYHNLDSLTKVDENIKKAIEMYTTNQYYWELNNMMRNKKPLKGDFLLIYNTFKTLFTLIPPLKEVVTLYRSINADELNTDYLRDQFVSTSIVSDPTVYPHSRYNQKCCFLKITVPPGTVCLPIILHTTDKDEYEVLLDSGSDWILTGAEENVKSQITYYLSVSAALSFSLKKNASENIKKRLELEVKANSIAKRDINWIVRDLTDEMKGMDMGEQMIFFIRILRLILENDVAWNYLIVNAPRFRNEIISKIEIIFAVESAKQIMELPNKIRTELIKYSRLLKKRINRLES